MAWAQLGPRRSSTTSSKRSTPTVRSWWATLRSPWWSTAGTSPSCRWDFQGLSLRWAARLYPRTGGGFHPSIIQGVCENSKSTPLLPGNSSPSPSCSRVFDRFLFLAFVFNPTVDQGGDRLHPVGHQRVQPSATGQPACHQRQRAVREPVRSGRNDQLPERRGARPSGAGPDSPYRYAGSQSVIVCAEGGGRVDKRFTLSELLHPHLHSIGHGGSCDVRCRKTCRARNRSTVSETRAVGCLCVMS